MKKRIKKKKAIRRHSIYMKSVNEHIRDRLLGAAAYADVKKAPSLAVIKKLNWFPRALRYARNRMLMGFYRYGNFKDPTQPNYDRIGSAISRLKIYQRTGNTEHVIDALNLCGIEFENPNHPDAHFQAIDDGYHTQIKKRG